MRIFALSETCVLGLLLQCMVLCPATDTSTQVQHITIQAGISLTPSQCRFNNPCTVALYTALQTNKNIG